MHELEGWERNPTYEAVHLILQRKPVPDRLEKRRRCA